MGVSRLTEKLFYTDAYQTIFSARVLACEPTKGGWAVTLDRTAFYPEGGGQPADTGVLGNIPMLDVQEREGTILHTTNAPLAVGTEVEGAIDWARRFSLMQNHTGEHIVSGIINSSYGLDNIGFHMGSDAITIDFNGELTAEQLSEVERLANQAIYRNIQIVQSFPEKSTLQTLSYRSKKELSGAVRIVTIAGYDTCACCGLHTKMTGEIGLIKLLSAQRYKGGIRIRMLCGERAFSDCADKADSVSEISHMLSAKPHEVAAAVERLMQEKETLKQQIAQLNERLFAYKLQEIEQGAPLGCIFEEGLSAAEVRKLCLLLCERCGVAAVFSQNGAVSQYAIGCLTADIRPLGKQLNDRFAGRGGGMAALVQGSLDGTPVELEQFLTDWIGQ